MRMLAKHQSVIDVYLGPNCEYYEIGIMTLQSKPTPTLALLSTRELRS